MYLSVLQYVHLLSIMFHKECTHFFTVNIDTVNSMCHAIIFQYNHTKTYQYLIPDSKSVTIIWSLRLILLNLLLGKYCFDQISNNYGILSYSIHQVCSFKWPIGTRRRVVERKDKILRRIIQIDKLIWPSLPFRFVLCFFLYSLKEGIRSCMMQFKRKSITT